MLDRANVASRLPAKDLNRARAFYAEKLGLEPVEERPGGLLYRCGSGVFALFASAGSASGTHTQMGFEVADIATTVAALRAHDGIATIEGNYPSKGTGEYGAWFRDSEGNLLGIGQAIR
jgi:catechol 2,3-dioxygenase-like lactoylglutathione lyase family enzyme